MNVHLAAQAPSHELGEAIDCALGLPYADARRRVLAIFERAYVASILARYDGSVARAACASGLSRRYFNTLLARHRP